MGCVRPSSAILAVALMFSAGCRHAVPKVAPEIPITVTEVRLEGFDVLQAEELEELRDDLPLQPGAVLTDETERAAADRAIAALQNRGHPYAHVRLARVAIGKNSARVDILADPGTRGLFGAIEIAGNRRIDDQIIRRRLAYVPGDRFSRAAIERSQQRIGALGLFKSVEIRARDVDARPAEVPTVVTVEERSPWLWNLSLGYAAGERLGIGARVSHLNFFGGARRLDLEGRVSRIERAAEATVTQTQAWHPALSFALQAQHQELDERAFFVLSRGGQVAATWQWHEELSSTVSYASTFERSRIEASLDLLAGLQDGMLNAWALDLSHRAPGADTVASMKRNVMLHVEQAGGWMPGTFHYYNLIADARAYRPLSDARVVLAGRMRYGLISPMADEADIPLVKRFFLGGWSEMRGWGRYEVSPLSDSGVAIGGKSLLSATGEARFPILRRLRGAVFFEAGNVWQRAGSVDLGNLLYDAGPGIRLDTPFGLLRVDFGYQLRALEGLRIEGEPQRHRWRLNFGIGEAF